MEQRRFEELHQAVIAKAESENEKANIRRNNAQRLTQIVFGLNQRLKMRIGPDIASVGGFEGNGDFRKDGFGFSEDDHMLFAIQVNFKDISGKVILPVAVALTARYLSDAKILVKCEETGAGAEISVDAQMADFDNVIDLLDIPLEKAVRIFASS